MTEELQQTAVVAIFGSRTSAEAAVVALHHEGLDMARISIDGHAPQPEQHSIDAAKAGEFIVLVHGTAAMIVHAHAILGTTESTRSAKHADIYGTHIFTDVDLG